MNRDAVAVVTDGRESSRVRLPVALLTTCFFAAYMVFDLREGGRASSLLTTRLSTPSFYIEHFGGWYFWGSAGLDAALALASAALVVTSLRRYRTDRAAPGRACASAATLLFGYAVFGCPGCTVPLFGTLGVAVFANTLPLFGLEFKIAAVAVTVVTLAWRSRLEPARFEQSTR